MKRTGLVAGMILFLGYCVHAQEPFDKLITVREVDCADVSLNAPRLIKQFLNQSKEDSLRSFINYWSRKCGEREPVFRMNILLALLERNFNDTLLTKNSIELLYNYKTRMEFARSLNYTTYDYYKSYFGFIQPGSEFDQFTQTLALELKPTYPEGSVERLLAGFYSDEDQTFFIKLQEKQYEGTVLQNRYNTIVNDLLNYKETHLNFIAGIWIPTGDIKILGNHPDVGFQVGYKKKKWSYDFTLTFKWGDTPEPYWAKRKLSTGVRELTREFFGGYLGFDVGRDVFKSMHHEIQLLAGIGFDGFDVFKETSSTVPVESVASYNLNFGAGYRYYFTPSFYMGLRAKYNVVDYRLNDVIDFTGNPVTIHFAVGGLANQFKRGRLKQLDYTGGF